MGKKKSNKKNKHDDIKGITLIALVVTIIVLIILTSTSINLLVGDNSIINKAKNAKDSYLISQEKEIIKMAYIECQADEIVEKNSITADKLQLQINKTKSAIVAEVDKIPNDGIIVDNGCNSGSIYEIKMQNTYYMYTNKSATDGFYKVSGKNIIDSNGNIYVMKGMGFGNNVWQNKSTPTYQYNDEEDYKELSELGFNHIRYYLNTNLLVNKDNTEEWNEEGFEWINQNIEWAKKYNITFVLNLHVPPGGFMSSNNANFWKDDSNIELYKKIWKEIATRYANETMIVGYGLMNEPFLPEMDDKTQVLDRYYNLINETISLIRQVDKNHIFFIESPYGYIGTNVKYFDYTESFRLVNDENTAYEYHFYYPNDYSIQGLPYATPSDSKIYYGDDYNLKITGGYSYLGISKELSNSSYNSQDSDWQYIESPKILISGNTNSAYWLFYTSNIKDGTVYFDDLEIKEYDEEKNYIRTIRTEGFTSTTATSGWDLGTGGGGKVAYSSSVGHNALGSIYVTNANNDYRFYNNSLQLFLAQTGHYYTVSTYVKFEDCDSNVVITPALQFTKANTPYILNKDYLEYMLNIYLDLGNTNNVPIYIGEFGLPRYIFGNEYKGEEWVSDIFDLLKKYNVSFAYHDFHNENWGYYYNSMNKPCSDRNEILRQIFINKLK